MPGDALLPVSAAQAEFLSADKPFVGFVGGVGSGKSWILCYDVLARRVPGGLYMVAGPTYPSLRDSTLRSFLDVCEAVGARPRLNESQMIVRVCGCEILFRSADDPEKMRGPNLSGVSLDEASLMHEDAFRIAIGRLRQGGAMGWLRAAFTPKGKRHWTYKTFATGGEDTAIVHARTDENPFLDEAFEQTVRRQYTTQYARQELGGEFVELGGAMIQREWLDGKILDSLPAAASARVRYWDTAATEGDGAFSVGALMARYNDGRFGVEDIVRGRWSAGTRDRVIRDTAELDRLRYGHVTTYREQEPGGSGKEVGEAFVRMMAGFAARADRVTGDKVTRFQPFAAQVEAGNVLVKRDRWTDEYLDELCSFPEGEHLDQADASSGGFNKLAVSGDWSGAGGPPAAAPAAGRPGVFRAGGVRGVFRS